MRVLLLIFLSSFAALPVFAADSTPPKPKYGKEITLLSQSHGYINKHSAPDFWAIDPYYIGQQDDRSCSVASVAMIVNASRMGKKFTADDELVTQPGLLKKVNDSTWNKGVGPGGHGVSLDQLKDIFEKSFKAYGVQKFSIEIVHTKDTSKETKDKLHKILTENEKSAKNFIVANFIQGIYTGDAEVGHIAPVGAYDSTKKQVLIFDPDRQWYEPYWVSEETFLKGMVTQDKESGNYRGYVWIKIND